MTEHTLYARFYAYEDRLLSLGRVLLAVGA